MKEFEIRLASVQDVQEFVSIATSKPYPICVRDYRMQVNGKSFIGMVSLDHSRPLLVQADCEDCALESFRNVVQKFLTEQ